jgi:hypothetical protein
VTLLDPWSAAAAAGIGVPALLVLYLLKLRRRRVRVSSTLLWEWAVEDLYANEPFRWLRPSLVLLVQLLALGCLATALGRPTVRGAGLEAERVLVLIDRSASMRAADMPGGVTRLEAAKIAAFDLVDDLAGGTPVQVIAFAVEPVVLTGMTPDHAAAARAIRSIEPTDQPGDLGRALDLASSLGAGSVGDEGAVAGTRVVLVTDGGADAPAAPGMTPIVMHAGPAEDEPRFNVGIVSASASRDFSDPAVLRVFVRVQSAGGSAVRLSLEPSLDGKRLERIVLDIPEASQGPASASATIELVPGDARVIGLRLDIDDALEADNSASLVLPDRINPGVLLVSPSGDQGGAGVGWVVAEVLEAIAGDGLRVTDEAGLAELRYAPDGFDGIDMVVLDRAGDAAGLAVDSLSFGVPLPGAGVARSDGDSGRGADRFVTWERGHAAMRGLALDGVTIAASAWFELDEDRGAATLARGRSGPVIAEVTDGARRRVGVAFEPARSTWPLEPSFAVFVAQVVETMSPLGSVVARTFETGVVPAFAVPRGVAPELTGPETVPGTAAESGEAGSLRAVFALPRLAGVYALPNGAPVAVNLLDPVESALASRGSVGLGSRRVGGRSAEEGRREVWAWFVVAGTALLTLEWFMFAARVRA